LTEIDDFNADENYVSKTRKKQLAKEVEEIAVRLTTITDSQLAKLELPSALAAEVELARSTRGRSSHKRQIKHLAGLLRKQDEVLERLLQQMDGFDQVARTDKKQFHQHEQLRDRLCSAETFAEALDELIAFVPDIDRRAITRLARSVHQNGDKRAYREIFKRIRQASETAAE